jgi:exodeoxyribonuclease VII small subunit
MVKPSAGSASSSSSIEVPNPPDFETAMRELEALVQKMESGDLSLEQSLAAYKRGAELVKSCRTTLTEAQQQVRILEGDMLKTFEVPLDASAGPATGSGEF